MFYHKLITYVCIEPQYKTIQQIPLIEHYKTALTSAYFIMGIVTVN